MTGEIRGLSGEDFPVARREVYDQLEEVQPPIELATQIGKARLGGGLEGLAINVATEGDRIAFETAVAEGRLPDYPRKIQVLGNITVRPDQDIL